MADQETKKGVATRDFRDAGKEENYKAGETYDFTPGEFDNYEHAGLIEAPEQPAPASKPAPTPALPA